MASQSSSEDMYTTSMYPSWVHDEGKLLQTVPLDGVLLHSERELWGDKALVVPSSWDKALLHPAGWNRTLLYPAGWDRYFARRNKRLLHFAWCESAQLYSARRDRARLLLAWCARALLPVQQELPEALQAVWRDGRYKALRWDEGRDGVLLSRVCKALLSSDQQYTAFPWDRTLPCSVWGLLHTNWREVGEPLYTFSEDAAPQLSSLNPSLKLSSSLELFCSSPSVGLPPSLDFSSSSELFLGLYFLSTLFAGFSTFSFLMSTLHFFTEVTVLLLARCSTLRHSGDRLSRQETPFFLSLSGEVCIFGLFLHFLPNRSLRKG